MKRLFLFAIGGTGVRIVKALTFLLGSGITSKQKYEIVPIILDPHTSNENLKQTVRLLEIYEKIRNNAKDSDSGFFTTTIRQLKSIINDENLLNSYLFKLGDTQFQQFSEYIDYDNLSATNKALIQALYSEENLETDMNVGFVGNPHMGSLVMNEFKFSTEFKAFASGFNEGDRIMVIGSIFGGTGASGLPAIIKSIRRADLIADLSNKERIKNAPIGALSVQPYFTVDPSEDGRIQKSDWMIKTRSALHYYQKALTNPGKEAVNVMYYLADKALKSYENDPGEKGQNNQAHYVEMIGALSVLDFMNFKDSQLQTERGNVTNPKAKEYGLANDTNTLSFHDFGEKTKSLITKPLSRMFLFMRYMEDHLEDSQGEAFTKSKPALDNQFLEGDFYAVHLKDYFAMFRTWLSELQTNERSFTPFEIDGDLQDSIRNLTPSKTGLFKNKTISFSQFNSMLNKYGTDSHFKDSDIKFLEIMDLATEGLIEKFYPTIN